MTTTQHTADVVVVGGGHNALIAAAYLVAEGLSVDVLEARSVLGGGTVTEELTLPGFLHDSAATGHIGLQFNPAIASDELGLRRHGLRYAAPDPVALVFDERQRPATMWLDEERTARHFGEFHANDERAYHELMEDWRSVAEVHISRMAGAPGTVVDKSATAAQQWAELAGMSAWNLIHDRFRDDRSRLLLLWLAAMSTQPITAPGTGMLAVGLPGMMSQVSWTNALGGSGSLPVALRGAIEMNGLGAVHTGKRVSRILVEGGVARGVETTSGEIFHAERAVLSSAHAVHLRELVGAENLPSEFDSLETWRPGASMFVVHVALRGLPRYKAPKSPQAVVAGSASLNGLAAQANQMRDGHRGQEGLWLLGACSSFVDASRAPAGHATLKVLTAAPYELSDGQSWDSVKEEYADFLLSQYGLIKARFAAGDVLARTIQTPLDLERWNLNNIRGGHQGGEMTPDQMGPNRPVKGWSGYRMPIRGLYQTGASTHPGGTASGFPGRNAARVVLEDVGRSSGSAMATNIPDPRTVALSGATWHEQGTETAEQHQQLTKSPK